MNRREFLHAASGAALGMVAAQTGALAASSASAPAAPAVHTTRRLVLATPYPAAASGTHDAAVTLARKLEHLLGEVSLEVREDSRGSLAAFEAADADITLASEALNITACPPLALVAGLPGRFAPSLDATRTWLTGKGHRLWTRAHAPARLVPLYAGSEGEIPALWSKRRLDAVSGLTIAAAPGLRSEVLAGLGAKVITLAPGTLREALATGAIDSAEIASLEDALALGIPDIAPHCLEGLTAAHAGPLAFTVAPRHWRMLSPARRQAIADLARTFGFDHSRRQQHNAPALKAALAQARGLRFSTPPPALSAMVDRLSEAVVADLAARFPNLARGAIAAAALRDEERDFPSRKSVNVV